MTSRETFQRQIRRAGKPPRERSTRRERSQEDDDAVRRNLPPVLVAVFDKHRKSFKGSARRSRTEQFLEWAEENPDELVAIQQAEADLALKELLKEPPVCWRCHAKVCLSGRSPPWTSFASASTHPKMGFVRKKQPGDTGRTQQ
jgi:hypothetical protein